MPANRPGVITRAQAVPVVAAGAGTFDPPTVEILDGFGVVIQADPSNSECIRVGMSGMTHATGYSLAPGATITLYVTSLQIVHFVTNSAGQTIRAIVEH